MKSFAFTLAIGAVSAIHQYEVEYMNYISKFGKTMNSIDEFDARLENFILTDTHVNTINDYQNSWTAGHNQFSDWTHAEYKSMLGLIMTEETAPVTIFSEDSNASGVNWVTKGGVTPVKDQCQYSSKSKTAVEVSSYGSVTANSVSQMKAALNVQPVSVLVEADQSVWQTYKSGVLNTSACGTQLDHAVLAVGYGSEGGQEYWLVKNSWNTYWGDQGYIKLAITGDNDGICGVQMGPTHAS